MEQNLKIIRKPAIFSKVGLSDPTIWRLERIGEFPKRIKLSSNSVGWLSTEVDQWLQKKAAARLDHPDESARKLFKKRDEKNDGGDI